MACALACTTACGQARPVAPPAPHQRTVTPAPYSTWPWRGRDIEGPESLAPGVRHWMAGHGPRDTVVDLLEFDTSENSRLRLEIYDQDEDDSTPFDDHAEVWPSGVGRIVRHLEGVGRGPIVAAWNGLFFSVERQGATAFGRHVAPVVLCGRAHYNVGDHRWTFGVRYADGLPQFDALFKPPYSSLGSRFDFAAGGAQCLVRDGRPLRLAPAPAPGAPPERAPPADTPADAGHIPLVDHMKTSRASIGWSRDGRRFYLLFVTEPDNETESALALKHGTPDRGGWTLADLQRFWLSLGVWGAINSDGGDVAQLAYRRRDGRYVVIPPRWTAPNERLLLRSADLGSAPAGGSLMYFYVRE